MKYRLLIAIEVLDFTAALSKREQHAFWKRFREINEFPDHYADYQEPDSRGRLLDVHVHCGCAIHFWDDHADRQIKILQICRADR